MPPDLLHNHPQFADLIRIVAEDQGIAPALVEKDYWIMQSLYGLQQLGLTFELKGGTSLSKGYGLISRFSEDIDIRIEPPANPPVSEVNAKVTELNAATLNALNGEQFMLQLYRQLPFNNPAYRQLAAWLTTPFEGALLQHCAVGKDRTGVGCALTLFAVGCDSETVMEEYLLTHGMLTQVEAWMLELLGNDLTAQGRQSLADILTVKESYLAAALSAIHQRYGTVDAWLAAEYQLTAPVRAALQARLLEE